PLGSAASARAWAGWPPLAWGPAAGGGGAWAWAPPVDAFASLDFGGGCAVATARPIVVATSRALTPITPRLPVMLWGKSGRVRPNTDRTTAHRASRPPAM